ncbi:hypothetical protein PILCRDRAFT_810988 [Piloderma croceum F 1598]|uniref:Uncharacterized protein n=1 Tax=Piloderma croceum (strain F 1598) TaxID=765440 RepID=A0A0C3G648_PILCF|nr:hypothetical protein PILCRDRAFT_810988 [Piloderma croceum F 1598]
MTGHQKPTNSSFKVPLSLYSKAYGLARLWHQTSSFYVLIQSDIRNTSISVFPSPRQYPSVT